jgi:alanine racemase
VPRRLGDLPADVLVGGARHPIAGTVTMDQIMVDCGPGSTVAIGDEVVLIGRQGDEVVPVAEWADQLGTIEYEIVCGIGPRVPRVHLEPTIGS